ncbi:MAG: M48 family metalloprotease [Ferruginibacter sp.]|nr:M48 family metalloprotease [Cytophagales bacterium]
MKHSYPRSRFSFLLLVALSGSAFAQGTPEDYRLLQSSGPIPADFLQLSSQKYEQEKAAISRQEKSFEKKAKQAFFLKSSFLLHDLLYSGQVLFNDPVGGYVNQVADQLLAGNPSLRKQIRIYVVKSPSVNAFATNSGVILINLGLIAQLETESQLAFVLSHELTHYLKKHVMNQYVEEQKIEQGKRTYRSLSAEEKLLSRSNYSQELETEADLEGLATFLKSNYSTRQLNGVFDVLQYSYLPFDDVPFEKSFFETPHLQLPAAYFLGKVKAIALPSEVEETKSSHPSINKRRASVLGRINRDEASTKGDYLVSKAAFAEARQTARYELSYLYLSGLQYEKAIYHSYLLLKEDSTSRYLRKNVAKALYGLSQYANQGAYAQVHDAEADTEGCSQQVVHLFGKLTPKELNALALKYVRDLGKEFPEDTELPALGNALLKSLVLRHCESDADFATRPRAVEREAADLVANADTVDPEKRSKYQKIAITHLKKKNADSEQFIRYAFVDDFRDPAFSRAFGQHWKEKQASNQQREETTKQQRLRERGESQQKVRAAKLIRQKGAALGIDKIVMISPSYAKIDERKKKPIRYVASERAEVKLVEQIQCNARAANLVVDVLSDNTFTSADAGKFNDYARLRNWIRERVKHLDAAVPMHNSDAAGVGALVEKYGTKYYCWTGFVSVREKKPGKALALFTSMVVYPLLPFGIYYVVAPDYNTYYYSLVFDLTTGEPVFTDLQLIDRKNTRDVLNSTVHNTFYQLKNKR